MSTLDLSPLYRNAIGFDRLASLLDYAAKKDQANLSYPAYDIEAVDEDRYAIYLSVAGFGKKELDIEVENGVLTIKGTRSDSSDEKKYLYQGISARPFERKFSLAEHVEVMDAKLDNGILKVELKRELPEALKPRRIEISADTLQIEHQSKREKAA